LEPKWCKTRGDDTPASLAMARSVAPRAPSVAMSLKAESRILALAVRSSVVRRLSIFSTYPNRTHEPVPDRSLVSETCLIGQGLSEKTAFQKTLSRLAGSRRWPSESIVVTNRGALE